MSLHDEVQVLAHGVALAGAIAIPDDAMGVVLFAHGSGSGRQSPRNQVVARALERAGFATLLVDLLTPEEEALDRTSHALRFDIGWLADRLLGATHWVRVEGAPGLPIGYFGASTGAAAALVAAAREPYPIGAIVSRGGRPDLAGPALEHVRAATMLIVGGDDHGVVELNREAYTRLHAPRSLEIVPGASHLFEEPGTLDHVARLATAWITRYLAAAARPDIELTDGMP